MTRWPSWLGFGHEMGADDDSSIERWLIHTGCWSEPLILRLRVPFCARANWRTRSRRSCIAEGERRCAGKRRRDRPAGVGVLVLPAEAKRARAQAMRRWMAALWRRLAGLPDVAHAGVQHVVGVGAGEVAVIAQVDAGVLGDLCVGAQPQHHTVARRLRTESGERQRRRAGECRRYRSRERTEPCPLPPSLQTSATSSGSSEMGH